MENSLSQRIAAKQAEVSNYERILREYQSGRWYDQGRRRLAELKRELADLEASCDNPSSS